MKPLVSILIPAYNAEQWIGDTIRSALAQTWPRKEIIIVEDGSRDRTLAVAQQFASKNVFVVAQENQGAAVARNRALELCQGDYIQWLDADDLLSADKVAKQMAAAGETQDKRRLFSSPWGYFMYRTSRARFLPSPLWCDLSPIEWLLRKWEGNYHMQTATWLVSRELTEAAGPWDARLLNNDDAEYFCRVLRASNGVRFVPGAKVFYRASGCGTLSYVGHFDNKIRSHFLGMQLQIDCLRSMQDSERVRAACVKHLQTCFIYFYPEQVALVKQLEQLTETLGGRLEIPKLPWKYSWMQKVFGWTAAKRARQCYNRWKSCIMQSWDKVLFRLERHNVATNTGNCDLKSTV
jgi:glycosyltransferase involved in cell wall biosynthesis